MVKISQNVKIQILCKFPAVCYLHRVLLCTGIALDDIVQIDCLASKYFVFSRFSLVGYTIWYCVVCDYNGTSPLDQANLHLSGIRMSKVDNY